MREIIKKGVISLLTLTMMLGALVLPHKVYAEETPSEYTIYPTPQSVTYNGAVSFTMSQDINVVYDATIDQATKDRTQEVMKIKGLKATISNAIVAGKTNILVGTNGSTGPVDQYFTDKDSSLFNKFDAYQLVIKDNIIAILGRDTDAAFAGVTSLKHIFNQVEDMNIRELTMKDYAEVKNRGFIEGYYGNPWSNEDRADLMTYGGDYKLNQYIYAPKDDPKHNSAWKTMYTEAELAGIEKAVAAGNASKCYYVYALHPFMSNAIRFDTEEHYQEDLAIVKEKFIQLMNVGVKQFSILADDASVPYGGSASYVKLMVDINTWLIEQKANYEGLRTDLTFCPSDYYGNATSAEMQGLKTLPEEISVIQTGGWIWGSTNNDFLNAYETNMGGSHPFMWINWPCSDGTKDSLVMGGMERFLIPGADPSKMRGIVLNPMQQSEANKSALFAVADYSWNVWQNQADVDKMWRDSFNYMDHGTIEDTKASIALRELSKHMMNSNTGIPESKELAPKLTAFRTDFEGGKDIAEKANELIAEFTMLKESAVYYRENPGNERTRDQIRYWMNCWEDRMEAGINYLKAALAIQNKEANDVIWSYFANGQAALEKSKTNEYWYINHYEYATVGRQHITPFITSLDKTLSNKVSSIVDPNKQVVSYITNRNDASTSDQDKIFDNNAATEVVYQSPNSIEEGTYIGVSYTAKINLKEITFLTGTAGNKNDTFSKAKVQYTEDGELWKDINDTIYSVPTSLTIKDLNLNVKGVRLIATEKKENTWLGVRDIIVNPIQQTEIPKYQGTISLDKIQATYGTNASSINDNDVSTHAYLKEITSENGLKDYIPVDATVTLTFDEAKKLGKIKFVQDKADYITDAVLEYTINGTDWLELGTYNAAPEIILNASDSNITAKAVRIRNKTLRLNPSDNTKGYWWKVFDFSVTEPTGDIVDTSEAIKPVFEKSDRMSIYSGSVANLIDGNEATDVEFKQGDPNKDTALVGDFIGYDLGRLAYIGEVDIVVGGARDASNKFERYKLEYSKDKINWTTYKEYTGKSSGKDTIHEDLQGAVGRYIRLTNMQERGKWVIFSEFRVTESQSVPVEKYIYSNTDYALKTITLDTSTELVFNEPITLNKDQYIGVKLARIKDLTSLDVSLTSNPKVTIQISINGVDWTNVTDYSQLSPARYVRAINETDAPMTFNIEKFKMYSNEVSKPSLYKTTMTINGPYGGSDSRNNGAAFDGDVDTVTNFADYPLKDQYIIYDLGQMRDVNSLKLYVQDTLLNYIRDAKFYISEDEQQWNEVMTIGDGIENIDDSNVIAKDSGLYKADNTYPNKFYTEATNLNVRGRYLKIQFTAPYMQRFVTFNEILINGGEYVQEINDPTFETSVIEKRGFAPQNMFDGDLTTSYVPNTTEAGYIIYNISDNVELKKFNIVQKGSITNTKVFALVNSTKSRSAKEWVQIGSLDKSLNEFYNPFYNNIYALKFEWDANKVPQISEIISIDDASVIPDRSVLQTYINGLNVDKTKYTKSTYDKYVAQLDAAKATLNNNNSTQTNLDDALTNLTVAFTGLVEKGDLTTLQAKVDEISALDANDYTPDSYKVVSDTLKDANALLALDANEITKTQVADMLNKLQVAKAGLVSSLPMDKDALKNYIASNQFEQLDGSLYLTIEFTKFKEALEKALLLIDPLATPTAEECAAAAKALRQTRSALILKATIPEIKALSDLANSYDKNKYTPSSWNKFETIIIDVKNKIQENELSSVDVSDLREKIITAAEKLILKGDTQVLTNLIAELEAIDGLQYTEESNKVLQDAIQEAKELLIKGDELTQAEIDAMVQKLMLAKQGLVELKPISPTKPDTNDSTNIGLFVGMGLVACIAIKLLKKKED